MSSLSSKKRRPRNHKELRRYLLLQILEFIIPSYLVVSQKVLTKNQNIFLRIRSSTSQIPTIRLIIEGVHFWFHIQRKDGANTSSIWSSNRNCYFYNHTEQRHNSNALFIWWWHGFLWDCHESLTRKYIGVLILFIIYQDNILGTSICYILA